MEFMWLGTKRMERLAKAHLSPISKPRHINSIFKNECYSTVNQSISKEHPIVALILWAKQRINRFWSKKMCRNSTFTFAPRPQKKVSSLLLFNTYLVMWKYNCEPLWLSGYNTEIIVGNVFGECHAPYTLKISFVTATKVYIFHPYSIIPALSVAIKSRWPIPSLISIELVLVLNRAEILLAECQVIINQSINELLKDICGFFFYIIPYETDSCLF